MHLPEPGPSTICSLIHISDPHFGSGIVNSGNTWWRKFIARIPVANQITGLFPHDYQVAGALAVAVRHILKDRAQREIPTVVVHTGDLTAGGKLAEFCTGATFLRSAHLLPNGAMAGFRLDQRNEIPFDIPGNHDLWSRSSPKSQSPYSDYYGGSYPIQLHPPIETPRGKVRIFGLDSNRSTLWAHRLANGEVPHHQLQQLSALLTDTRNDCSIKIVCLHHPIDVHPSHAPRLLGFEILKLRHRAQLAQFLKDHGVHLVLTGHVHRQRTYQSTATSPLQIVAGSCCQIGNTPSFALLDLHPAELTYHELQASPGTLHFLPATSRKCTF
ncbi:MAG: metallophosphoesterase [Bryobacterales bacterium]|nr:metallophosphoesterase [Bryobacterales bacterium]